jgi:hypothetical protein
MSMPVENGLPTEAHAAMLRRDEVIRRALESASGRGPQRWEVWAALASAGLVVGPLVYFATKDPFVAIAAGAGVAALNLAVTSHSEMRKQHAALVALIEVVQKNENRRS